MSIGSDLRLLEVRRSTGNLTVCVSKRGVQRRRASQHGKFGGTLCGNHGFSLRADGDESGIFGTVTENFAVVWLFLSARLQVFFVDDDCVCSNGSSR